MKTDKSRIPWALVLFLTVAMSVLSSCAAVSVPKQDAAGSDQEYQIAMALLHQGKQPAGEAILKELAERRPIYTPAHRELQRLRLARYEHFDVIRDYQRLVDQLPESGAAHYLLGRLLYRIEDQRSLFESAVSLAPENPWGFQGLAWNDAAMGKLGDALHHLNLALAAEPGHQRSRYLMARLFLAQDRTVQARGLLKLLLEQFPNQTELWILQAQLSNREGKFAEELDALEEALALDPDNKEARVLLLDLAAVSKDEALGYLAFDLGRRLVSEGKSHIEDLDFLARLEHAGRDDFRRRRTARRALEAGSKSLQALHDAAFSPQHFLRAWSKLYETDRLQLSRPMTDLVRLAKQEPRAEPVALATAFVNAGFLNYGQHLVDELERQKQGIPGKAVVQLAQRLRRHRRTLARIQVLVDKIKREKKIPISQSLPAFLDSVKEIIEAETGYQCHHQEPVLGLPLVGAALDSSKAMEGTINGYLKRFNQVMFSGRLDGSQTQAVIFSVVSGPNRVFPDEWPNAAACHEFIGAMVAVRSEDESFGDSAGRALFGTYFVDEDILMPWQWRLARITKESAENQERILKFNALEANGSNERLSMAYPGVMADALVLKAFQLHGELLLLDEVVVHEQGHLLDSLNYLPLWQQILPNLLLVIRGGFSAIGVMADLEDAAAHHALKYCQSPHLVLAELVRSLPQGKTAGPHARGYKNLLARFLIQLDAHLDEYKQISSKHVLMHQLHLLSEDDIRRIAEAL